MRTKPIFLLVAIVFCYSSNAQYLTDNQILKLEQDSANENLFVAKIFNINGKLSEYWTMLNAASEVSAGNFNELAMERNIIPHGKHYVFYPNGRLKFEENYEEGESKGEIKGYYISGKIKFEGIDGGNFTKEITHYHENGAIRINVETDSKKSVNIIREYYPDGKISSETTSGFQNIYTKYQSFYPDGNNKREQRFEFGELKSEKCFDKSGKKVECMPFNTGPEFPGGSEALITEMDKIVYNSNSTDTTVCDVTLTISSSGKAELGGYHSSEGKPLFMEIQRWVNQLPSFKPATRDGINTESEVIIAFPLFGGRALIQKKPEFYLSSKWDRSDQEPINRLFFEFTPPTDVVYYIVERMPEYPGGDLALRRFIANNLRYPAESQKKGIQGKIYVSFIIDKTGQVAKARIARGVHPLLDAEALRVVNSMPLWKPGFQRGKPVYVSYTIPINFVLQ